MPLVDCILGSCHSSWFCVEFKGTFVPNLRKTKECLAWMVRNLVFLRKTFKKNGFITVETDANYLICQNNDVRHFSDT